MARLLLVGLGASLNPPTNDELAQVELFDFIHDESNGHIGWTALHYYKLADAVAWLETYGAALPIEARDHDTLSEAADEISNRLTAAQIVLNVPTWAEKIFERGHIAYGHTHIFDFEIATRKDRKTHAWYHATIVRLDSGRYELNTYTL